MSVRGGPEEVPGNQEKSSDDYLDMHAFPRIAPIPGHRSPRAVVALLMLVVTATLGGCGASGAAQGPAVVDAPSDSSGYRGTVLRPPERLDAADEHAHFASTEGGATTLAALQADKLMLVYFGYTHCPDVCPTTMSDLGTALRRLPAADRERVQVVFITSDPARDTTAVMRAWLSNFDGGLSPFVGLTASNQQIDSVAKSIGVPIEPPVKHKDGSVSVQHGAQTLAFVDGEAHVLWSGATRTGEYSDDIARLVARLPAR